VKNDDNCKYYIKQISHLLPLHTKKERLFLNELKDSVMRFTEETQDYSIDCIMERFGNPLDVVHDYLLSMNEAELQKALSKRRLVTGCIVTVLIGMLIVFLSFRIHLAQLIKQAEETVIETRVIYIDHESGSE